MRRKKTVDTEYVLFNVMYEDGTQSSNRKVPASEIGGFEGDEPAMAILAEQDRDIGEKSGRPRAAIKSISRSDR